MTKSKNYWNVIKDQETTFSGGSQGFEVPLRYVENWKYDPKTGKDIRVNKLTLLFPFGPGDGVPTAEKRLCRKEVMFKVKKRRELAKASSNHAEYIDLQGRIHDTSEEEFNDLLKRGLKGFNLRDYIIQNYLTNGEAYSLFYRM